MLEYDREFQRRIRREMRRRRIRRERMIGAGTLIAIVLGGAVLLWPGGTPASGTTPPRHHKPPPPPQLPRGGRIVLPAFRVVAFDGAPQDPGLGQLGVGTPDQAAAQLVTQAARYERPHRPVLPAMELIATVAQADPGLDGMYRMRQSNAVIARYLAAARRIHALLLLDIQPGRSSFLTELAAYKRWLRQPDVGLALDPEWSVRAGQRPGDVIGSTDGSTITDVARVLSAIVARNDLPQKLLLVHRFTVDMIQHPKRAHTAPGVALVYNIDGYGDRPNKVAKYRQLAHRKPGIFNGFKLFFHEDTGLMRPGMVLALRPAPDVVVYE
jgi:hypothetical protein